MNVIRKDIPSGDILLSDVLPGDGVFIDDHLYVRIYKDNTRELEGGGADWLPFLEVERNRVMLFDPIRCRCVVFPVRVTVISTPKSFVSDQETI